MTQPTGPFVDPTAPGGDAPGVSWSGGEGHGAPAPAGALPAIPGYEVEGVLGRGGMAIVYRARQVALKRDVALKMLRAGEGADAEDRDRFRREGESAARLQHP